MTQKIPQNVRIISCLGLIPFLVGVVGTLEFGFFDVSVNNFLVHTSILYAALILSFLGGCLFGFEIISHQIPKRTQLWIAVLPTLWSILVLSLDDFQATALILGFMGIFEVDRRVSKSGESPDWWLNLRLPLTFCVVICLAIIGFHD